MIKPVKFTDISVFQPSSYHYMKQLKADGSQFNFVKLTEGNSYVNAAAASQISNSLAVWGQVGLYHFWHGESASFFIHECKEYDMDLPTTKVALDVEADGLPRYCTDGVNKFEHQLVEAGFNKANIWTYVSVEWLNKGRVDPSKLQYGFIWAAEYPYPNVYSDLALSGYSRLNPGYNAWQFSGLGSQDWSYAYGKAGQTLLNDSESKRKPKHKLIKHHARPKYLQSGHKFEVITNVLHGYSDQDFSKRNGWNLKRGSQITGSIIRFSNYTRLYTKAGWFSTNAKYLKAVK